MTTEIRTIQIEAYRDADGRPTCRVSKSQQCKLYFSVCGTCVWTGGDIRGHSDGIPRPVDGCPVWGGE